LSIATSTSILFLSRNVGINLAIFFKMSGRGGINNGRRGRGSVGTGRGGSGGGRVRNYTGSANEAKGGLCTNLGTNVFDYGQKSAADQMRTSW
jgi:hypothetical protein